MVGERTHDWTRRARGEKKKMVTQFFMAMRPPTCTAQEKQVRVVHGKPQFYEPQALKKDYERNLAQEAEWLRAGTAMKLLRQSENPEVKKIVGEVETMF